jgi:hypothetical protein
VGMAPQLRAVANAALVNPLLDSPRASAIL